MSLAPIIDTFNAVASAERAEHERTYPDRLYQLLSRQIDQACDEVERVNLAGGGPCPDEVGRFVEQLQRQAGGPTDRPRTSAQAHDELFRLSSVLLGRPEGELDFDREDEVAELEAER
jgi:hypothetical protein